MRIPTSVGNSLLPRMFFSGLCPNCRCLRVRSRVFFPQNNALPPTPSSLSWADIAQKLSLARASRACSKNGRRRRGRGSNLPPPQEIGSDFPPLHQREMGKMPIRFETPLFFSVSAEWGKCVTIEGCKSRWRSRPASDACTLASSGSKGASRVRSASQQGAEAPFLLLSHGAGALVAEDGDFRLLPHGLGLLDQADGSRRGTGQWGVGERNCCCPVLKTQDRDSAIGVPTPCAGLEQELAAHVHVHQRVSRAGRRVRVRL